jgi:RND family efflux transporter MFP subunit
MKRIGFASLCLMGLLLALWFLAGPISRWRGEKRIGAARAVLYYRDPMNPSYVSDRPGKAPDGMDLEPVYAEANATPTPKPLTAPAVEAGPERQDLSGVRVGRVESSPTTHVLRTFGRVTPAEDRIFPVTAGVEGWVAEVSPGTATGTTVKQGQPLVSVYGRDFTAAQRAFLYALRLVENPPPQIAGAVQDQPTVTLAEARLGLQNIGVGDAQIQQLTKDRQVMLHVSLTAPAGGVIVSRNVFPQQKFDRGTELLRIADLSHVWIVADLLGGDASYIRSGSKALLSLPNQPAPPFRATVAQALPQLERESQAMKVRLEADNPRLTLRPDMLVDIEFQVTLPDAITVPAEAIVQSGQRSTVFVKRGEGVFEPRDVDTGWRFGGRVQILRGVNPGESIAVSGTFLLDSEIHMRRGDSRTHD